MSQYSSILQINAPLDLVFQTVSDIGQFSKAIPHIIEVEFLTEQKVGVGTRFKETRLMNKQKATTTLEVTEYVKNESIRLVSRAGGSTWDSLFTTKEKEGAVNLELLMIAKPHHLLARFSNSLIRKMLQKALESDMEMVKLYCESIVNE